MALTIKRYKSAPITEAVIELRVQPPGSPGTTALERLADSLASEFPKRAPMQFVQMGIEHKAGEPITQSVQHSNVGFRLNKADDSRVLQIRHDGFAISHMRPYSDWDTFKAEARPLWDLYRATCSEAKLSRCALRYINRIDIPGERIELREYFALYPEVPDSLPQHDINGLALNLQIPQPDLECVANIGQVMVGPVIANHLSIVLDIDVFRLGIESWTDSTAWEFLDRLRHRKNEIFEGCITEQTKRLIDQ
ncbi:MAG TPA: TIGR04255 family protein [Casimicrobiaceae bacterium]|nr:TIGR04255 family protein [Casimicrobiaceae bacterium]